MQVTAAYSSLGSLEWHCKSPIIDEIDDLATADLVVDMPDRGHGIAPPIGHLLAIVAIVVVVVVGTDRQ